jgi:hypothetical protein
MIAPLINRVVGRPGFRPDLPTVMSRTRDQHLYNLRFA